MAEARPRTLIHLIHELSLMSSREFNRRVRDIGLTRTQWHVLYELHRLDGQIQSQIAEALAMAKPPCGRIIDRLEADGWVRRAHDSDDRRVNRVFLTDKDTPLLPFLEQIVDAVYARATRGMTASERRALQALLGRVHDNLSCATSD
ncbi:MAG: MarR family winged helix-turn-helix transcriptional regulator [Pseudomonadales bacterium]